MSRWTTIAVGVVAVVALALGVVALTDDDGMMDHWGTSNGSSRHMAGAGGMAAGSHMVAGEEDYLVEMVAHHQEAITAARELERSDRPEMRAFGADIVRVQSAQVDTMQGWLAEWYPDAGQADYEPMMRDLSGLSGDELDRTFLEDMVRHHMAAVMMSRQLRSDDDVHPEVADLADSIATSQLAEIDQMERWLSEWFGD